MLQMETAYVRIQKSVCRLHLYQSSQRADLKGPSLKWSYSNARTHTRTCTISQSPSPVCKYVLVLGESSTSTTCVRLSRFILPRHRVTLRFKWGSGGRRIIRGETHERRLKLDLLSLGRWERERESLRGRPRIRMKMKTINTPSPGLWGRSRSNQTN